MKEITVITFENHGQDFSTWEIDSNGMVIDCRPFQATTWCGCLVLNADELKKGAKVKIQRRGELNCFEIKYPLTKVVRRAAKFVVATSVIAGEGVGYRTKRCEWVKDFTKAHVFAREKIALGIAKREGAVLIEA